MPSVDSSCESSSLTPRIIRPISITVNPYILIKEYADIPSEIITRLAINIYANEVKSLIHTPILNDGLHKIEKEIFDKAFEQLNRPNTPCVVLVDVLVREKNSNPTQNSDMYIVREDYKTKAPETHTVCLWKQSINNVMLIDPSNSKFTAYLKDIIERAFPTFKTEIMVHTNDKRHKIGNDDLFYSAGLWVVGGNTFQARDCIDIAVKIALIIIDGTKQKLTNIDIIQNIKQLSNQNAVNSVYKPNNTIIRELQSSISKDREEVKQKLKDNSSDLEVITVNTLAELNEVDKVRKDNIATTCSFFRSETGKDKKHIKEIFGKITTTKLKQYYTVLEHIEAFSKQVPGISGFSGVRLGFIQDQNFICKDDNGYTELHTAVIANDVTKVIALIKETQAKNGPKQLLDEADPQGQTALHWATGKDNLDVALTEKLVDVMTKEKICLPASGNTNYTALHLAVHTNKVQLVNPLLEKCGRDLAVAVDIYGQTALHWAVSKQNIDIINSLLKVMAPDDLAIQTSDDKCTALHFAVSADHVEGVKALLDKGERKLAITLDKYNQTPLFRAMEKSPAITALLLDNMLLEDIAIKQTTDNRISALHYAVYNRNVEAVRMLLMKGGHALTIIVDKEGRTPLHYATVKTGMSKRKLNIDIIKLLVDVMTPEDLAIQASDEKTTALHLLVSAESIEAARILLNKGGNRLASVTDKDGETALDWAKDHGHTEIQKLLEHHLSSSPTTRPTHQFMGEK